MHIMLNKRKRLKLKNQQIVTDTEKSLIDRRRSKKALAMLDNASTCTLVVWLINLSALVLSWLLLFGID